MSNIAQSPETRRSSILQVLDRRGECSVDDLAQMLQVSAMTIRRDLQELSESGQVIRTHGGATPSGRVSFEFMFLERMREHAQEKNQIAEVAARLTRPGQTVILDSGTTTLAIARALRHIGGLTVVTTSLPVASELFGCEDIEIVLLGGRLRRDAPDLVGGLTDRNLDEMRVDVALVGADAVDLDGHAYNAAPELARMLTRMGGTAQRRYVAADFSKIGSRAFMRFATLSEWTGLITDDNLTAEQQDQLIRAGVVIEQPRAIRHD